MLLVDVWPPFSVWHDQQGLSTLLPLPTFRGKRTTFMDAKVSNFWKESNGLCAPSWPYVRRRISLTSFGTLMLAQQALLSILRIYANSLWAKYKASDSPSLDGFRSSLSVPIYLRRETLTMFQNAQQLDWPGRDGFASDIDSTFLNKYTEYCNIQQRHGQGTARTR